MKKILFFISILSVGLVFSQSSVGTSGDQLTLDNNLQRVKTFGSSVTFFNPKRLTDGTFYLFDKWNNYCIIQTEDNQKFVLRNINLNLERHTFESKVEGDSIFTFSFNNIDKFIINGKTYKNYYWDEDSKVYEIIYDNNNFQILKGFRVELLEGSANPMVNRSRDKYIRKESYHLRSNDNKIKPFKLKRSRILKLINGDIEKVNKIDAYTRNNNLSFKREKDLHKILEYSLKD
ncbi:MAG: hypothetical protein DRI75_10720 [Bacteroidetes bacterium]|nr:MAG: hypothetical protein DRI75_10720 [Bacteroidota bacterium]